MWTFCAAITAIVMMWAVTVHTIASLETTPVLIPVALAPG
jgi:hypothetical protein